jgi:tRNA(fMet)-specific endonuclease VapC
MRQALIDTDILSMFFRGHRDVVSRVESYVAEHIRVNISILTYYEIVSGLKHKDAHRQLTHFLEFASQNNLIPLTEHSVILSSKAYADTRAKGIPIDDIDLLIAGVALANEWVLVTHNTKHFDQIAGLRLEDWSKAVAKDET